MIEQTVSIERMEEAINIFGSFDENMRLIEKELGVHVVDREEQIKISGEPEPVMCAAKVIQGLIDLSARGEAINEQIIRYLIQLVQSGNEDKIQTLAADVLCVTAKGKPVKAKTVGQKKYLDAIRRSTITLGVGPAGTGKTYLAVAAAVAADYTQCRLEPGDALLLCSDGLYSMVDPTTLRECARQSVSQEDSKCLIDAANSRGGRDNITAVIIWYEENRNG